MLPVYAQPQPISLPPFSIECEGSLSLTEMAALKTALNHATATIKQQWDWNLTPPVRVHIFQETWQFTQRTGMPWWIGAVYQDGIVYLQSPSVLRSRDDLNAVLTHELMHVIIAEKSGGNCPRWLNEALALITAETENSHPPKGAKGLNHFSSLDSLLVKAATPELQQTAYHIAWQVGYNLRKMFTKDELKRLLTGLKTNPDIMIVFAQVTGTALAKVEKKLLSDD